jgi:neutral ceramidase
MIIDMRRSFVGLLAAAALGVGLPAGAAGDEGALRVGLARTDITPEAPVTLSGYESRKALSTGVHDPLSARVIVFERDGHRLVLVSTDLIGFYGGSLDATRKTILKTCRLESSELFLTAIHTHSAPNLAVDATGGSPSNVAYTKALGPKLAAAVNEALAHMAPARLAAGSGSSPVGVNRREPVTDRNGTTRIVLGRNPAVMTDREVQVLVVQPADAARPAAVLFAYASHSTSLGPGNLKISGDVHGIAAQFVEAHLGHGLIAPEFAGASGDIDPWFRVLPAFQSEEGWVPEPVLLGTMLGEEVVHVADKVKPVSATGPVRTAARTLELPAKPGGRGASASGTKALEVTVGRVGDVAFVGLGCEAFNAIGKAIKAGSPFRQTLVITHCNGASGYLPTRESYPAGGYEIESSSFAPGADETLVQEVLGLLKTL